MKSETKAKVETAQSGMSTKIDRTKVAQVYSGNLDLCACGCSGKYGTLESSPRLFNKVLKTMESAKPHYLDHESWGIELELGFTAKGHSKGYRIYWVEEKE